MAKQVKQKDILHCPKCGAYIPRGSGGCAKCDTTREKNVGWKKDK